MPTNRADGTGRRRCLRSVVRNLLPIPLVMIVRDVFGDRTRLASAQCPPADPAPDHPSAPPPELGICCKGVSGMNSRACRYDFGMFGSRAGVGSGSSSN